MTLKLQQHSKRVARRTDTVKYVNLPNCKLNTFALGAASPTGPQGLVRSWCRWSPRSTRGGSCSSRLEGSSL